jgi:hypothetical protein
MTDDITVHDSNGNVFADVGIENLEEYLAKSELAAEITKNHPNQPHQLDGSLRRRQSATTSA